MSNPIDSYRPIRHWNEDDRPREKLEQKGRAHLSSAELLAILLGSGTRHESAVELAKRLLNQVDNNLVELGKLSLVQMQQIHGIGPAKAITVAAAIELGRRRQEAEPRQRAQIRSSRDLFDLYHPRVADLPHEEFWVSCLNRSNKLIQCRRIGSGGISATVADIRLILKFALECNASSIVLCHNHPSGNMQPSEQDVRLTRSIANAVSYLDIQLLDHVIVTEGGYFSFNDEGKLASV